MKILGLLLRNFGKFQNQKLRFESGINIIYGENESGKSTIHTFIKGMLFGIGRGRGRASVYDTYSIYEPWENPGYYSGILRFESGGKTFRIDRNFDKQNKKAELVCEDDGENLSIENGDLELLLGGMDLSGYDNTISVGQLKTRPDQSLAAALKEYATSCCASGNGDLRPEQANPASGGTKKTIDKEIREALYERQRQRENCGTGGVLCLERDPPPGGRRRQIRERIRQAERTRREQGEHKRLVDEIRPAKWRIHPLEIVIFLIAIVAAIFLFQRPLNYFVVIVVFLACTVYVWNRMKVGKDKNQVSPEEIMEEILPEEERASVEKLGWELERTVREQKDKQIQYENLQEQLAEMDVVGEKDQVLEKKRQAVQMAIDKMNELSEELKLRLEKQLNEEAARIVCQITNQAYQRIRVEDNLHMFLVKEGKRIAMEQVSQGTAEQIWFALRMAAAGILQEEEMPVILDDAFGNYDDERLKSTLGWLDEHKKQVFIFTCQKREMKLLDEMGISYHLTEI